MKQFRWPSALFALRCCCVAASALLPACQGFAYHKAQRQLSEAATQSGLRLYHVDTQSLYGISDLTAAPAGSDGQLWLLPERQRSMLSVSQPSHLSEAAAAENRGLPQLMATQMEIRRITGVPDALDTESMALLGPERWLLGTESHWPARTHDALLLVSRHGDAAEVTGQIDVPYDLWNMRAHSNEGIEGLCVAGERIVVGIESVGFLPDGSRFAPIGRLATDGEAWTPFRLRLTSNTGKISALACRVPVVAANEPPSPFLEVIAIERHFFVTRILRFLLPRDGDAPQVLEPTDIFDVAQWLEPLPNFEGIAWLNPDEMMLVSDNSMGVVVGATEALVVPMRALQPLAAPSLPGAP